jgi:chorismate mutase/prephenate dehydratase
MAKQDNPKGPQGEKGQGDHRPADSKAEQQRRRLKDQLRKIDRDLLMRLNTRAKVAGRLAELPGATTKELEESLGGALAEGMAARNPGPLEDGAVRAIFRELASGCQALGRALRVGYLGPNFSYSHAASIERFGQGVQLLPLATIAAVFEQVAAGNLDYGVVPLENSTDGRIADTLEMFATSPVRISGEVLLPIHHHLLCRGPRSNVAIVCSRPQAISQCRHWLAENLPDVPVLEVESTAVAAQRAAGDSRVAAIAGRQAAVHYGLQIVAREIEDNKNNVTRFAVICRTSAARSGRDKTALVFQILHRPGALADVMQVFKRNRLNLTWIESLPLVGRPYEYLFFVELQGHEKDLRVRRALTSLERKTERLAVLGSYPESGRS